MKILTILGARPQFVKASVFSRVVRNTQVEEVIVHTGQHYDDNMSSIFFKEMEIPEPKYHLGIKSKHHGEMSALMIIEIEKIAIAEKPDWILVYGDTNSTLAGAIVASKLQIKLAHVEAGLRSYNNKMPEEINRIVTDRLSNLLLCPTINAYDCLKKEGFETFAEKQVVIVGDIMFDAALFYSERSTKIVPNIPKSFNLCTLHRAENTDDANKLTLIFETLNEISREIPIVLPIHPRTKDRLSKIYQDYQNDLNNIIFIEPVSYLEMIYLLKNANLVFTDSGGLQKEAYFFKKKCLTLRDETEWVELVENGYNELCQIDKNEIINKYNTLCRKQIVFDKNLYGDGNTGNIILKYLENY
jgi:UDP-GlcNAc3NAcA epimerase